MNHSNAQPTGKVTTHVLDTMHGLPGSSIKVDLYQVTDNQVKLLDSIKTNFDGRTDVPVLDSDKIEVGKYQLVFHVADYFKAKNVELDDQPFLDDIVIRFGVSDVNMHYHVPLLVSPYSYSTYRGS